MHGPSGPSASRWRACAAEGYRKPGRDRFRTQRAADATRRPVSSPSSPRAAAGAGAAAPAPPRIPWNRSRSRTLKLVEIGTVMVGPRPPLPRGEGNCRERLYIHDPSLNPGLRRRAGLSGCCPCRYFRPASHHDRSRPALQLRGFPGVISGSASGGRQRGPGESVN
jgi:hypothetical protein